MTDLVLEGVSKSFGDRVVLSAVDLRVGPGETVAITGPSGSGKSTLLNIVGSLDAPTSGTVLLGDFVVAGDPEFTRPAERARNGERDHPHPASTIKGEGALAAFRAKMVGFVFQEHLLLPQLTATENVLLPTLALGKPAAEARALELLEAVGVAHRAAAFPAQMSGGERQRVAVARAMVNHPALLLCDEPTGNLDQETGALVVELLVSLASQGAAVFMATHNQEHAAKFSRRVRLVGGRLEE